MKKFLPLFLILISNHFCQAQQSVVCIKNNVSNLKLPLQDGISNQIIAEEFIQKRLQSQTAKKGLGLNDGYRTYNYVELLGIQTPTIFDNSGFPYFWGSAYNGIAFYYNGYGAIDFASIGQVIQPWYNKWNNPSAFPNDIAIEKDLDYRLDTVKIYGVYMRNPNKPAVIDTMLVSIFYGNGAAGQNIEIGASSNPTLLYDRVPLDTIRNIARPGSFSPSMSMIQKVVLLTNNRDTFPSGLDVIKVPVGLNVPQGNMVGVTYTFKTGDPAFTPFDTVLIAASANSVFPKFSIFRPNVFEQNAGALATYYADSNFNNGLFHIYPLAQHDGFYRPMYFLPAAYALEFPNIDFVIFCQALSGVTNTSSPVFSNLNAYPSPANEEVTIPITLLQTAEISVTITNMTGQIILTKNLGKVPANTTVKPRFSTLDLPSGTYFYTVNADGQRVTNRFVVAH